MTRKELISLEKEMSSEEKLPRLLKKTGSMELRRGDAPNKKFSIGPSKRRAFHAGV